ncbi:MAG TPA: serine/threonine-protein kinase, partial [Polyangiaceae bacterium]
MVAGRYRLVRELGEGGMGAVWVAEDQTLRSQVAIKLLHSVSEEGQQRFLREAQSAARLRSPHVVQIIEHGVDGDVPFIAMELLDGESLATRLARVHTLTLAQTARVVTHVARAIGKAHEAGIIHRDLKPDNVFIVHNDDEEIIKVLDFGIAKVEHAAEAAPHVSTEAGAILGTPYYMSPEQVRGHGVDFRSDLWSLAMISFECVCGRLPFEGKSVGDVLVLICSEPLPVPSTLRPTLPASFDAWFAKAGARDPEGRFQSAKEMSEALRAILADAGYTPDPAASGETPRVSMPDARTLDADSVRVLGEARTVSASGTMSGASSAISKPARKPWGAAALVVGAIAIGAVAWASFHSSSAPSVAASSSAPAAPTSPAIVIATTVAAPATTSAAAVPVTSASAVASSSSSSPKPARTARPTPTTSAKT